MLNRYLETYGDNTWEMAKSAFSILVERVAKYAAVKNNSIMVYYEEAGRTEDRLIKQYFNELRSSGHPFNNETAQKYSPMSVVDLAQLLRGIEGKRKSNLILQLADLCLYPVVHGKGKPDNRAFVALKENNLLVDSHLDSSEIDSLGIKYYCFDNL
jgi:hypothetical protein